MSPMIELSPVRSEEAPAAIGPYVQAVVAGDLVFCSGQIAIDPATGELEGTDVASQCRRVLDNLAAVLGAAGTGLERAVRLTVYLTRMDDFPALNEVYADFFPDHRPARATVEVARLPKGALVEIDCIAAL